MFGRRPASSPEVPPNAPPEPPVPPLSKPMLKRASTKSRMGATTPRANPDELTDIATIDQTFQDMFADRATFYHNLQTAIRGAVAVTTIVGMLTYHGFVHELPEAYQHPALLAMIGFWFVLTFGRTMGFTIRNAWQALTGTLYAVLNSLIMNTIFPGGAKNAALNGYREEIAWIDVVIVVLLIMVVNVSNRCRTFALFYTAMFMTFFMNPKSDAKFSRNFQLDVNGTGVSYLMVCLAGTTIAIFMSIFPWPRRMTVEVQDQVALIRAAVSTLLIQVVSSYNGQKQSPTVKSKCQRGFNTVQNLLSELGPKVDISWWEGFDLGYHGKVRHMMIAFATLLKEVMDIIHGMQLAAEMDSTQSEGLLRSLRSDIAGLTNAADALLTEIGRAIHDGDISDEERSKIERRADALVKESQELAEAYTLKRVEAGVPPLDPAMLEEDFFIYNLAQLSQAIVKFAMSLREPAQPDVLGMFYGQLLDLFDPMVARNHGNFVLRGFTAFMVAFIWGVSYRNYNFVMAATVALVMSKFMGSAVERNLGRMQGVVLGLVIPAIALHLLDSCNGGMGTLAFLGFVFLLEVLALYIYQAASPRFAYIAMLTAAFAAKSFFVPCDKLKDDGATSQAAYAQVTAVVVGIIIVMVVDIALANERPSEAVQDHLGTCFFQIREGFEEFLKGNKRLRGNRLKAELRKAWLNHREAINEPRYWRVAYPETMVEGILQQTEELRLDLRALEHTVCKGGVLEKGHFVDGVVDPVIFEQIRDTKVFQRARRDLLQQFDRVTQLIRHVMQHESETQNQFVVNYEHNEDVYDHVDDLAYSMTHLDYSDGSLPLLDDPRCRGCVAIFMITRVHKRLDTLVEVVLRH
mmetsp:Transcript_22031/g.53639  ORF Transcript_22031/g.53639 Transcript_22031/m.53639 type:complete len:859 (+) Transcript_22031:126-2702(+)